MPFQKGRAKTGGRVKGQVSMERRSAKFSEQLKGHGFNYPRELADALLRIKKLAAAIAELSYDDKEYKSKYLALGAQMTEAKFFLTELKSLLPYMAAKLLEKEIETTDEASDPSTPPSAPVTTEELLKAASDVPEAKPVKSPSRSNAVGARRPDVPVQAGAEADLLHVAGEQEDES